MSEIPETKEVNSFFLHNALSLILKADEIHPLNSYVIKKNQESMWHFLIFSNETEMAYLHKLYIYTYIYTPTHTELNKFTLSWKWK